LLFKNIIMKFNKRVTKEEAGKWTQYTF
jgi:hypothetical protein